MYNFIKTLTDSKDKTKLKAKEFAEVTTPLWLVQKQLDLIPSDERLNLNSKVLDPCTGDGRYLMMYLMNRLTAIKCPNDLYQAISTLHGIELQAVNVARARHNLYLCTKFIAQSKGLAVDFDKVKKILAKNIHQGSFIKKDKK